MPDPAPTVLRARTFEQLNPGDSATLVRPLGRVELKTFARVSGDLNPTHVDADWARRHGDGRLVAHAMWVGALFSSVLGNELPGPGTTHVSQRLRFERPVREDDTLTVVVTVREKRADGRTVVLDCRCTNQHGEAVAAGVAEVLAPTEALELPRADVGERVLRSRDKFAPLLAAAEALEPMPAAVVHPCSEAALCAAVEAAERGLIRPILVGPATKLHALAASIGLDLAPFRIVDVPHSHAAAEAAVALVRAGEAELLVKGSLHTDELLGAVVERDRGLRTERRLSHVFLMDVPTYPKLLLITDAAINIVPTLDEKRDICQNAIDLARALGIARPKVAILSAVETVNSKMPSTMEAASLCKMADRGQITGGVIDGPLAMDNAISAEAAAVKGIRSDVAGDPDILLVPDLEAGNILAKQLTFMAGADAAGVVVGARVPIVLTSRADGVRARLASCAVAVLMARARRVALPT
ncbi:MAG: bifunctional enoyl-CoA hydratase/phosphate acetyltransferase [Burkholderiaceae bacterium]|jgi:phosphate acetyltransferase|nr:bifunctional enoyl-CoA hydratase/phosphate acetyltransferase [Burkholderiales bacterium]MCZ8339989.1 bifunctional enoyl-CoA hydratase/phosphate acetyltransferase [Burkholderiaceae bacterium]